MAEPTVFHIPGDIIPLIFTRLPNAAILSTRLVSKTALSFIQQGMEANYTDKTLDGTEVQINFTGDFKIAGLALFQHRKKMKALDAHPKLQGVVAAVRSDMVKAGLKGPFTVQDFLDFAKTFDASKGYRLIRSDVPYGPLCSDARPLQPIWLYSLPLALVPFDLCDPKLTVPYRSLNKFDGIYHEVLQKNDKLPQALYAAAKDQSLELITLVLSHPFARYFSQGLLADARFRGPNNAQFYHVFNNHICEERTYSTLKKMIASKDPHSLMDYVRVFNQFTARTRYKFFEKLCKEFGSPNNDIVEDGIQHFVNHHKWLFESAVD